MNDINNHIEIDELIIKRLSGNANADDNAFIDNWISQSDNNNSHYLNLQKTWDYSTQLDEFLYIDADKEWSHFKNKVIKKRMSLTWMKYAAVIAIIFAGSLFAYLSLKTDTQKIIANQVLQQQLPDGSQITLNKNSSIEFAENFEGNERRVILNGDAWFSVEKNPEKPFIIENNQFIVEVVGTQFYVSELPDKEGLMVVVESGKVAIYKALDKENKTFLTPGQTGVFSTEDSHTSSTGNNELNQLSWKTKRLVFENESLATIIKQIDNTYGVSIQLSNKKLEECKLTTTFENGNAETLLQIITQTLNLEYQKQGNSFVIKGESCY